MKLKLLFLSVLFCMISIQNLQAQNLITGKVTDEVNKQGLPGVSIKVKGTAAGAVTDANGNYTLSVNEIGKTLVFSFVGYLTQEVPVNSKTVINVTLQSSDNKLNEVVIIGYGTARKKDLTGALSQVKAQEINAFPSANALQALSGRAAGVQVMQNSGSPGGAISVRVRGTTSIKGGNEPLYVVDGFITGGNISYLNNADIESIDILKDASATAIYGSRGANGVVIVTTKRGKQGKTQVEFETNYSTQTLRKELDLMNAQQYATFYNEVATTSGTAPYFTQTQIDEFAANSYNWQDLAFQKAPLSSSTLSVNGGNEKTQFSVSGSAFLQDGIIKGSDFNRFSLRANLNHDVNKKLSFNLISNLSRIQSNRKNSSQGNRGASLISGILSSPPTLTPYNADGSYLVSTLAYPFISNVLVNPINFLDEQTDKLKSNNLLINGAVNFKPIPGLTIKVSGGVENIDDRYDAYTTNIFVNSKGVANVRSNQYTSLLNENTISYNKVFDSKHSLSALAGFTYQTFFTSDLRAGGSGFISNTSETGQLIGASTPDIATTNEEERALLSYLGRINYSLSNKYLATVSFRADGASQFSDKWGYFPSAALAWRISNEDFFKDITFISDLKLRAGWGNSASQAINAYNTLNLLTPGKTVFADALFTSYAPGTNLAGPLTWETTEQKDIGIDFGILNNRVSITADYYIKTTRDLLNPVSLPSSIGYATTIQNVGRTENRGFELGINSRVLDGAFKWDLSANLGLNKNKVLKLFGGKDILGGRFNASVINDDSNILREGQPLSVFYGYLENGYDATGKILYKDVNNDGAVNAFDRTIIGNPNPKVIYGLNSGMSYKNFDFSFFLQGTQGNDIFNISAVNNTLDYGFGLNMPKEVLTNHWTPSNTSAKYPAINSNASKVDVRVSDRLIEDGSYLRLKTIQLGYTIPTNLLKFKGFRKLQIYASGQNLLTFTKYSWFDPEVNSIGGTNSNNQGINNTNVSTSSLNQGYDYYTYPTAKSITFGLRAGL